MATSPPDPPDARKPTLTDDDVGRVIEEERLRARLRSEFEFTPKEKPKSGFWNFLNSSFGLFLLSSVLLAGITGLYTQMQSHARQQEQQNIEVLKVTTELKYRLEQLKRFSGEMKKAAPANKLGASLFIWYTVRGGPENYKASSPEFTGVTTYGLVSRLRLLGVEEGSQAALQAVIWLENGQTVPEPSGRTIYPQEGLDSKLSALDNYADHVLVPYVDAQRKRSFFSRTLF